MKLIKLTQNKKTQPWTKHVLCFYSAESSHSWTKQVWWVPFVQHCQHCVRSLQKYSQPHPHQSLLSPSVSFFCFAFLYKFYWLNGAEWHEEQNVPSTTGEDSSSYRSALSHQSSFFRCRFWQDVVLTCGHAAELQCKCSALFWTLQAMELLVVKPMTKTNQCNVYI